MKMWIKSIVKSIYWGLLPFFYKLNLKNSFDGSYKLTSLCKLYWLLMLYHVAVWQDTAQSIWGWVWVIYIVRTDADLQREGSNLHQIMYTTGNPSSRYTL